VYEILANRPSDFDCVLRIRVLGGCRRHALVGIWAFICISSAIVWRFTWRDILLHFYSADLSLAPPFAFVSATMSTLQGAPGWVSHHEVWMATPSCCLLTLSEVCRALVEETGGGRSFQDHAQSGIKLARVHWAVAAYFQRRFSMILLPNYPAALDAGRARCCMSSVVGPPGASADR
jgi:hypothetical protein